MQRRRFLSTAAGAAMAATTGAAEVLQRKGPAAPRPASGPLRVHPKNPRYFADGTGRAVRLGGHQVFCDLQDNSFCKRTTYGNKRRLDWNWYLDFAQQRQLNYLRNWIIWSTGNGTSDPVKIARPMMFARTGPGVAADGLPKFDLTRFDPTFFDRLHDRVQQAGRRGIYVSIMLFEPYGFGPGEESLWRGNVLNKANNINGIDVNRDGNDWGTEFFYPRNSAIRELQLAYVNKVIDTVNNLDNVLFEIANEVYAPEWQHELIRHIHRYEARKPKQHLVYMSPGGRTEKGTWANHSRAHLVRGPADIVGIKLAPRDRFLRDPPLANSAKPVFWDNDHGLARVDPCPHRVPWLALMRGYHFCLYDHPFESPTDESAEWDRTRRNIGATNRYARRFRDLSRMEPHHPFASTNFCLADPGREYLVYAPRGGIVNVDLSAANTLMSAEWFAPLTGRTVHAKAVPGGTPQRLVAPFAGDAVLHLVQR